MDANKEILMKNLKYIFLVIIGFYLVACGQTGTIRGKVSVANGHAPLAGANIRIEGTSLGTMTNIQGVFVLQKVPAGKFNIIVSYLGYESVKKLIEIEPNNEATVDFFLEQKILSTDEVVVTSTRYEKQLKDVSLPLAVVCADEIEQISPITVSEALQTQPALSLARDGIWATQVTIRGLSRQNIVTLVDGNRIETSTNLAAGLSLIDVNNIERVEVIKGAASSLYGSGGLGGVVNIISKSGYYADGFNLSGYISNSYSSVNSGVTGNLALNISDSNWYTRWSVTAQKAGNTQTPQGILQNSQFQDNNLDAELGFRPSLNHELKLKYQRFYARDVGLPGGSAFPQNATVRYPEEERSMYAAEYKISNISKSLMVLRLKFFHQFILRDVENIPNSIQLKYDENPPKRVQPLLIEPSAEHQTNGLQLQTDWYFAKKHYLIGGIDIWQRNYTGRRIKNVKTEILDPGDSTYSTILNINHTTIKEIPIPDSKYLSLGLYGQDEFITFNDKLNLTIGGRIDLINVNNKAVNNPVYIITNGNLNDSPPFNPLASFPANNADDISWSSNLGILYRFSHDLQFTTTVARSFRSPSLEERFQYIELGANTYLGDPHLKPEQGNFIDAGIRIWRPTFSFTGDLFLNDLQNLVIDQQRGKNLYVKSNVGKARLYGFDLKAEFNFYDDLVLTGAVAYVRGTDLSSETDLPEIPPLNLRIGLKFPFTGYLNFNLLAYIYADKQKVAQGELATPRYAYYNLYLSTGTLRVNGISGKFTFAIENMFDKAYRNHLSTIRGIYNLEPGRNIKFQWMMNLN
jgi:outer membrane receptor protein involved in Fe transport